MANESILRRLGTGLAAGLSPQAAQNISTARAQERGAKSDRQMIMEKLILSGVTEGSIPQEEGASALEQLGSIDSAEAVRKLRIQKPQEPLKEAAFETIMVDGVPTRVALDPVTGEQRRVLGEAQAKTPLVEVSTGDKASEAFRIEEAKQQAKRESETFQNLSDKLTNTQQLAQKSTELAQLSSQFDTGAGAELKLGIGKYVPFAAQVLGIDVPAGENIKSIEAKLNLEGTKVLAGAISEGELAIVGNQFGQLTKTPAGNFIISKIMQHGANNARDKLIQARRWKQEKGRLDAINDNGQDFESWYAEQLTNNPVIIGQHPKLGDITLEEIITNAQNRNMSIEDVMRTFGLF